MKKANKIFTGFLATLSMVVVLSGCVKNDYDDPPVTSVPFDANKIYTIEQIKKIHADSGDYVFKDIYSVYATVTMDDATGNIYKSAFIQNNNEGIELFLNASGLYQGDSIRIMLDGTKVSIYHELLQIQDVHVDSNIVKLKTLVNVEPEIVTMADIYTGKYQSKLIKLEGVQFVQTDLGKTYADAENLISENRTLETCDGSTIIVRTSGYATFAGEKLPTGKGSIIAIASIYNEDIQLVIRRLSEVDLTGERCDGGEIVPVDEIHEYFDGAIPYENISIQGWYNIIEVGDRAWQGKEFGSEKYAQATGYSSDLPEMITWLITPPIKMDEAKILTFVSAKAYWEHTTTKPFTVLASTNFDGLDISTATWTELNPIIANENSADNAWIESGDVDLSGFTENGFIAFKYAGSDTESTSFRVDDIVVSTSGGGGGEGVTSIDENFDTQVNYEDINIPKWTNINEIGSRKWQGKEYDSEIYAQATSYNSGEENVCWLITPKIALDEMTSPKFSFLSAQAYWAHDGFSVLISTDFDGSDLTAATWTPLDCIIAGQNDPDHEWIPSGVVDLSSYSGYAYIAFRYEGNGNTTETTSFRVDNVVLTDE